MDYSESYCLARKALDESLAWATHREWRKALKAADDAAAYLKGYHQGLLDRLDPQAIAP